MSKHTPGPWVISGDEINTADGQTKIAEVIGGDGRRFQDEEDNTECLADARLIAAAPDLLEALEAAMELGAYRGDRMPLKAVKPIFVRMEAAINKAKGIKRHHIP